MLQPPAIAPLDITVLDEAGQPANLKVCGKWLVVYFTWEYSGCTVEACSFRTPILTLKIRGW
jgi:peroxiredoxin